jgi:S-adenosylmethionine:tRNA ribosyltransferase-isomerase
MDICRKTQSIVHKKFSDIVDYLEPGDVLVLNTTKVIPARLYGKKETGENVEILLVSPRTEREWECLVKPGKKLKSGQKVIISDELTAELVDYLESGTRLIRFYCDGDFMSYLDKYGAIPLPPYISRKAESADKETYQTVYAKHTGSVAAPTAGLHFTEELLGKIKNKGIVVAEVILNVGLGTFRPVKVDNIDSHKMHSEFYMIDKETANILNNAKQSGKRILSVGTTSTRTLETILSNHDDFRECSGWTDIFIYPGYQFKAIDGLITNFHLPKSTLVMMVSALAGRENILSAYREAVEQEYRIFSFGDSMFIHWGG